MSHGYQRLEGWVHFLVGKPLALAIYWSWLTAIFVASQIRSFGAWVGRRWLAPAPEASKRTSRPAAKASV